jgi:hypothetical protein
MCVIDVGSGILWLGYSRLAAPENEMTLTG